METSEHVHRRRAAAWLALAVSLGIHVADEAAHDFLSVYNPAVESIRQSLPFLPLPVFAYDVWLWGLIGAVILLLALIPLVLRGVGVMRPIALALGWLMVGNGLLHIGVSLVTGSAMPGVWSSPLLLLAAVWLVKTNRKQ
jgi:hypothetical protein